jgi:tetratricopeptide (TPR) repeat protein
MTGSVRSCLRLAGAAALGLSLALAVPPSAPAEGWVLTVSPLYSLPLTAQAGVFSAVSLGGSVSAVLPFTLFGLTWLRPEAGVGYVYSGLAASTSSISAIEVQAGLQVRLPVAPWMDFASTVAARGGYYMLSGGTQTASGFSPGLSFDAGADFRLGDTFSLGLGAQGVYDLGMYFYLRPFLSASLRVGGGGGGAAPAPETAPQTPAKAELLAANSAETKGGGGWILTVTPLYSLPLTAQPGVFSALSLGGTISAVLPFSLFGLTWLRPEAGVGYVYSGLAASTSSISAMEAQAGLQVRLPVVPWMDFASTVAMRGGYYMLSGGTQTASGFSPGLSLDAGADFRLGDTFSLGLGAQGVYDFGMYFYLRPFLSASVRLGGGAPGNAPAPAPQREQPPAKPAPLVGQAPQTAQPAAPAEDVIGFDSDGVFPVFYKFYDNHPFGTVTITNQGKYAWTDVKVTFAMKQFMDLPSTLSPIASIPAGQAAKIDLVTLFNDSILSVTEATKISGELTIDYQENGKPARQARTVALRVFDRNAMTWTDDQRAAAFVTAKDPTILTFAKSLAGDLGAAKNPAISDRFQVAAGIHEALVTYGVNYVQDPTSIFAGSKTKTDIDFLQFPRQTLEYRSGDCDDLSILYASFFEAVGIETAFITVPGHIFMAISLDMAPDEAKTRFGRYDDLIFRDGKSWLPIEITLRKGGFLAAWAEGAREWRENNARKLANFLPVHDAWGQYEPVALPGSSSLTPMQNAKAVEAMKADVVSFVNGEIAERAAKLQADSKKSQGASKAINSLGVLYAQYGLYEKARAQFESIVAKEEYVPALVNLGNIRKAQGDLDGALVYYDRAFKKSPSNASVLLAEAIANHQIENYGAVKKYYQALKAANATLADRYAYLDLRGEEGARAADASGLKNLVDWMEGQ